MGEIIQKIPFLRLTAAFALGIIVGTIVSVSGLILAFGTVFVFILLIALNLNYKFRFNLLFGSGIQIMFVLLGIFIYNRYNSRPDFIENENSIAVVQEVPQEKTKSFKSLLKITAYIDKDSLIQTNESILAYFEKNENSETLKPGDVILIRQFPNFIKNNGNPYEFDYKKYLERQKIYRQIYLSGENWIKTNKREISIITISELVREKLLEIYEKQPIDKTELEILSALTLGYKRELEPETKRVFSSAGAMHVLAVSGLHVGIIFWIVTIVFGFLRKFKAGRLAFMSISILILWGYAFITGLSPSVMRAATMFSIFVIGDNLHRKANVYNSLAASAIILLLINPNYLFETGFQLSYSAVFGIVFLQPKLDSLIKINNKILHFFWTLLTISISAQIATFPIILFYFGQFPTYFWITNMIIIPVVMVLIPLGIGLLFFSQIPLISTGISVSLNFLIKSVFYFLTTIEKLPLSIVYTSIGPLQLVFIVCALILFFTYLNNRKSTALKFSLISLLFLFTTSFYLNIARMKTNEIIVYNSTENTIVQLIHGKINYLISEKEINSEDFIARDIASTNQNLHLKTTVFLTLADTLTNSNIFLKNGILFFEGKTIVFSGNINNVPEKIYPDILINPNISAISEDYLENKQIIITNKRYNQWSVNKNYPIHNTFLNGAFQKKW